MFEGTVVAQDFLLTNTGEGGPDVFTNTGLSVTDFGGNFVGNLALSTGFGPRTLTGNSMLGPVQANGGPQVGTLKVHSTILTMAPLHRSPPIAAGISAEAPQRRMSRGVPRPAGTKPTIGAHQ